MRSRTTKIVGLLAALVMIAAACGSDEASTTTDPPSTTQSADEQANGEPAGFDWRQNEGESINVLSNEMVYVPLLEAQISEFEELTGITVNIDTLPEEQLLQRLGVQLSAGSEIDVFTTAGQLHGEQFASQGFYEDLQPYIDDPALTNPDWLASDIITDVLGSVNYNDAQSAIPINLALQLMYYRTDILDQLGIEVPTTLEEFEAAVAAADAIDGIDGYASRGAGGSAVLMATHFLYTTGGAWFDDAGAVAFTSPESQAGLETYARLLREYGPDGIVSNSVPEVRSIFADGGAAFYTDTSAFIGTFKDAETSSVADTVGVAPMPVGSADVGSFFNWSLAMNSASDNKSAAWLFIQWATSPEIAQSLTNEGWVGARSDLELPENLPADWRAAYESTVANRALYPFTPPAEDALLVRDTIGAALVSLITDGDFGAFESAGSEVEGITNK